MKTINEYLLSKNKKIVDSFKQFETKEEVCNFFEKEGFKKANYDIYDDSYTFNDLLSEFSNSKKPIYCMGNFDEESDSDWWVRFGNGGEDEPIFFWNVKGTMLNNYSVRDSNNELIKIFKTFEEFKEYIIKYFNW